MDDPQRFLETVSDLAGATARIHDMVWSKLAAAVSRSPLETLVSVDAGKHSMESLVEGVAQRCRKDLRVTSTASSWST